LKTSFEPNTRFLADRTQYWRHHVVRLSVCLSVTLYILALEVSVHSLHVVPACTYQASSNLSLQTLLL